jgi:hypothetical protein
MVKKALRNMVKFIALIALIVFVFDNRLSRKSGLVFARLNRNARHLFNRLVATFIGRRLAALSR